MWNDLYFFLIIVHALRFAFIIKAGAGTTLIIHGTLRQRARRILVHSRCSKIHLRFVNTPIDFCWLSSDGRPTWNLWWPAVWVKAWRDTASYRWRKHGLIKTRACWHSVNLTKHDQASTDCRTGIWRQSHFECLTVLSFLRLNHSLINWSTTWHRYSYTVRAFGWCLSVPYAHPSIRLFI